MRKARLSADEYIAQAHTQLIGGRTGIIMVAEWHSEIAILFFESL